MNLALAVLAGTGYVTLLFELPRLTHPVEAAVLGLVYALVAVLRLRWIILRRPADAGSPRPPTSRCSSSW